MDPEVKRLILILGGLAYASFFIILTWRKPSVGLMLIFASAPFQQDLSTGGPFKFSLAEINMWLALPALILRQRRPRLGPLTLPVWSYILIGIASSLLNYHGLGEDANAGIISNIQIFQYWATAVAIFAVLPRRAEEYRLAWVGLVVVGMFLAGMLIVTRSAFVIGLHKNGIGASLACAFVVAVELWFAALPGWRKWCATLGLSVVSLGLVLSVSRGAWLGSLLGLLLIVALRRQFRLLLGLLVVLAPLGALAWSLLPEEARQTASSLDSKRENIRLRYESIELSTKWFQENPVYGLGIGLRKRYDATNVIMLALAETGVLGLVAFLSIHLVFFIMLFQTQRHLDTSDPLFSSLAIGGALVFYKFAHGCVDHYWSRGALMCACGGAGMALHAYLEVQRRRRAVRLVGEGEVEPEAEEVPLTA